MPLHLGCAHAIASTVPENLSTSVTALHDDLGHFDDLYFVEVADPELDGPYDLALTSTDEDTAYSDLTAAIPLLDRWNYSLQPSTTTDVPVLLLRLK